MDETVWVYPYDDGKKGDLLAIYTSNVGTGELTNFSITFRDHRIRRLWTYSFHREEQEPPYLNYTVDAVEGQLFEKVDSPDPRVHESAEIKLSGGDEPFDSFCFERLTNLSYAFVDAGTNGGPTWADVMAKTPPAKEVKFEISGNPEIVRHLKTQ